MCVSARLFVSVLWSWSWSYLVLVLDLVLILIMVLALISCSLGRGLTWGFVFGLVGWLVSRLALLVLVFVLTPGSWCLGLGLLFPVLVSVS